MREPIWNVGIVCSEHAPKSGLFSNSDPELFVGHYVKKAFLSPCGRKEHMWVKITHVSDKAKREMSGILGNDPVYATQYRCDDIIKVLPEEVEQILPG